MFSRGCPNTRLSPGRHCIARARQPVLFSLDLRQGINTVDQRLANFKIAIPPYRADGRKPDLPQFDSWELLTEVARGKMVYLCGSSAAARSQSCPAKFLFGSAIPVRHRLPRATVCCRNYARHSARGRLKARTQQDPVNINAATCVGGTG